MDQWPLLLGTADDIDVIEKMFLHKAHVALKVFRLHRIVFVEIEGHDIGKRQTFFLVHADQFGINAGWCGARRQTQHSRLSLGLAAPDQRRNFCCHDS